MIWGVKVDVKEYVELCWAAGNVPVEKPIKRPKLLLVTVNWGHRWTVGKDQLPGLV